MAQTSSLLSLPLSLSLLFFSLSSFKRSFSLPLKHATPYFLTFLPFLFLSIFMSTTSSFTSTMVCNVVVFHCSVLLLSYQYRCHLSVLLIFLDQKKTTTNSTDKSGWDDTNRFGSFSLNNKSEREENNNNILLPSTLRRVLICGPNMVVWFWFHSPMHSLLKESSTFFPKLCVNSVLSVYWEPSKLTKFKTEYNLIIQKPNLKYT